jgi:uncharacterized metal-binding protein
MLSPDLDLPSRPFKRWGWLRWIWIPYQKVTRHRSIFSHGPIVGTTLRVIYLGSWIVLLGMLGLIVVQLLRNFTWSWEQFIRDVAPQLLQRTEHLLIMYRAEWVALFVGLELGAMSHAVSDWLNSAYKRSKRKSRRKPTSRKTKSSRRTSKK